VDAHDGFREFVSAHQGQLSRVAYLLAGDPGAAEDLLQIALAKTAARWSRIVRYDRPEAYVRKVLYHEAVSAWRRRREVPRDDLPEAAGRDDESEQAVLRVVFARALRRLTPRQRAVLVLRFYEDRSVEQTAELLRCSTGTVKSQTNAALGRLRQLSPELADLAAGTGQQEGAVR
jgi:RNA polymerase sigma-70 factor (sigma-E family)